MTPIPQDEKIVSFLILDHNRPLESNALLLSLKKHIKLKKYHPRIIYLSNGGPQDYVLQHYNDGLIDELILRKENNGCGYATMDLFYYATRTQNSFYLQIDHILCADITDELIDKMVEAIGDSQRISHVDLSGNQGNGRYSERAHFINTKFYNGIPKIGGGVGPYASLRWTEEDMQNHLRDNNMAFVLGPPIFINNGKWSVRQWECGTETKHRTDTKEMEFTKLPKNGKLCSALIDFYRLTEGEIDVILGGNWGFNIPEQMKKDSFRIDVWDKLP